MRAEILWYTDAPANKKRDADVASRSRLRKKPRVETKQTASQKDGLDQHGKRGKFCGFRSVPNMTPPHMETVYLSTTLFSGLAPFPDTTHHRLKYSAIVYPNGRGIVQNFFQRTGECFRARRVLWRIRRGHSTAGYCRHSTPTPRTANSSPEPPDRRPRLPRRERSLRPFAAAVA